jgi:hypothetical protein
VARPASTAATTRARTSPCCGAVGWPPTLASRPFGRPARRVRRMPPQEARRDAVVGHVRLLVVSQLGVYSSACQQLGAWLILAVPTRQAGRCTPGALLSSDDFGSSVERRARGQVLWRVHLRAVLWRVE